MLIHLGALGHPLIHEDPCLAPSILKQMKKWFKCLGCATDNGRHPPIQDIEK